MRPIACLVLFLFCCHTHLYAQPVHMLNKPYNKKFYYLDSLRQVLGSKPELIGKLDEWRKWANEQGDRELAGEFLFLKHKVRWDWGNNDLKETELQELAMDAHENKHSYLEAKTIQFLGMWYSASLKKYAHAAEHFLTAYNIYSKFTAVEFPDKQEFLFGFGSAYYSYGDNDNAIKYFREALVAGDKDSRIPNTIYNSLGVCYRKTGKYDSAAWFFNKIYEEALKLNDSAWVGIAAGNIGITYFLQEKYDEAVPLLEKDIELSLATNQVQNAASSMEYLSSIYYIRKEYTEAENLLHRALTVSRSRAFWPYYPLAERLYGGLYKVYAAKNDMQHAYRYADSTIMAKDSVFKLYNALNLSKAIEKSELAQQKLEAEQLEGQRKLQLLVRNSLIAGILLITVIGILFINRQRLKQKKLEAEKKSAEQELSAAATQLSSFKESVKEKNNLIEQFTSELERIKQRPDEQTDEEVLTQLERSIILTDEQWEDFRVLFEKVHKNFFVNLKKKIPDLSQAEIRFLTLTKLKLSSKEMASMLGISTNAIRIYRHRIRKKLDLGEDDMIEGLVENL